MTTTHLVLRIFGSRVRVSYSHIRASGVVGLLPCPDSNTQQLSHDHGSSLVIITNIVIVIPKPRIPINLGPSIACISIRLQAKPIRASPFRGFRPWFLGLLVAC